MKNFISDIITHLSVAFFIRAAQPNGRPIVPDPFRMRGLEELFENILFAIFIVLITVLPLLFIYGVFILTVSRGDPKQVEKAKKIMIYAAIGFVVVLFARALGDIIRYIIGV
jgi:hypothetical protein